MEEILSSAPPLVSETSAPLRVVILYEDLDTGKQAKRTSNYLADTLSGICPCAVQLWKFNLLEDPSLQLLAAQDATEADIVMVAANGENELPIGVTVWCERWVAESGEPLAMVALFLHPQKAAAARMQLRNVAAKAGVDFFSQTCIPSQPADRNRLSGRRSDDSSAVGVKRF